MGVVNCQKHGKAGIALSCPHIADSLYQFQKISNVVRILEKEKDYNNKFSHNEIHYLCKDCDEKYKDVDFSEYTNELLEPVCAKCFKELSNIEN